MYKRKIQQIIFDSAVKILPEDITLEDVDIEIPRDISHGDFATNLVMKFAKRVGANPRELATKLVEEIRSNSDVFTSVEVAGPGFINFKLKSEVWVDSLYKQIQLDHDEFKDKKIIVEFTDPNPFKELHLGHLYQNVVGDSIARIHEALGAEVRRADYFGDVGMHVAKSLWGLIQLMQIEGTSIEELESLELPQRVKFLGRAYAYGATKFKEEEKAVEEIKGINKQVFIAAQRIYREKFGEEPNMDYTSIPAETKYSDHMIAELYFKGREWSLGYFDSIYERLGVKFDYYYPESLAAEIGFPIVMQGLKDGIFVKSDGAVVLDKEKSGLHTRVFVNSMGLPTYEAKELGLPYLKQMDFDFDQTIIVVGDEIEDYFQVLLKALSLISPEFGRKTRPVFNGMVKLPEGKMSSRTGQIIRAEDFLNDVYSEVLRAAKEGGRGLSEQDVEKISQAAIKFGFLKFQIPGDKIFSIDDAIKFEGETGPYLLYSYVRARSIMEKAGEQSEIKIDRDLDSSEHEIIIKLSQFEEVVYRSAVDCAPSTLTKYLFELSQLFNSFYVNHRVVEAAGFDKYLWVAITTKVSEVLKIGVRMLGAEVVDKM